MYKLHVFITALPSYVGLSKNPYLSQLKIWRISLSLSKEKKGEVSSRPRRNQYDIFISILLSRSRRHLWEHILTTFLCICPSCFIMDEEIILIGQYGAKIVAACEQVVLVSKDYDAILLRNGKWQNHLLHRPQVYPIILLLLLLLLFLYGERIYKKYDAGCFVQGEPNHTCPIRECDRSL